MAMVMIMVMMTMRMMMMLIMMVTWQKIISNTSAGRNLPPSISKEIFFR